MRIGRQKILRRAIQVRKIAAASSRDQDLLADAIGMFKDDNTALALARLNGAHQAGCAPAQNDRVEGVLHLVLCIQLLNYQST